MPFLSYRRIAGVRDIWMTGKTGQGQDRERSRGLFPLTSHAGSRAQMTRFQTRRTMDESPPSSPWCLRRVSGWVAVAAAAESMGGRMSTEAALDATCRGEATLEPPAAAGLRERDELASGLDENEKQEVAIEDTFFWHRIEE